NRFLKLWFTPSRREAWSVIKSGMSAGGDIGVKFKESITGSDEQSKVGTEEFIKPLKLSLEELLMLSLNKPPPKLGTSAYIGFLFIIA
ncbi:unnamed protein product, partial [Rotaria socialis]